MQFCELLDAAQLGRSCCALCGTTYRSGAGWACQAVFYPHPCVTQRMDDIFSVPMLLPFNFYAFGAQTQCYWRPNSMLLEFKLNAFERCVLDVL